MSELKKVIVIPFPSFKGPVEEDFIEKYSEHPNYRFFDFSCGKLYLTPEQFPELPEISEETLAIPYNSGGSLTKKNKIDCTLDYMSDNLSRLQGVDILREDSKDEGTDIRQYKADNLILVVSFHYLEECIGRWCEYFKANKPVSEKFSRCLRYQRRDVCWFVEKHKLGLIGPRLHEFFF